MIQQYYCEEKLVASHSWGLKDKIILQIHYLLQFKIPGCEIVIKFSPNLSKILLKTILKTNPINWLHTQNPNAQFIISNSCFLVIAKFIVDA